MALAKITTAKSLPVSLARTALEHKCLNQGVRITYTRRIILGVLAQAKSHLTVEDIYRHLLSIDTVISLSTLYSNIKGLAEAGVVAQRRFQSKQSYYAATQSESHDQLIDLESGQVTEFSNQALNKLKAEIAREFGFNAADCRVELYTRLHEKPSFENLADK